MMTPLKCVSPRTSELVPAGVGIRVYPRAKDAEIAPTINSRKYSISVTALARPSTSEIVTARNAVRPVASVLADALGRY
jgi:hypothetical protein